MTYIPRWSLLVLSLVAGCAQEEAVPVRRVQTETQEIQGGTVDTTSTNVVGIIFNTGQGAGICSGSLIAPNLVLTARHCVGPTNTTQCSTSSFGTPFAAGNFRITTSYNAAANTLNSGIWPNVNNTTWFGAAEVLLPPVPSNNICGGDIALIRLSSKISNICPLIPRVDQAVGSNEGYTAVGFGRLSPTGQTSGTRYTVGGLNVLCAGNCGFGTDGSREWVGGSNQAKGVCEGDSGGPALDSMRRVLGVVSRGSAGSCSQAVYVGVFGHASWIKSVALTASQQGSYTAAGWVSGDATSFNECPGALDGGVPVGGGGGSTGGGGGATGGGSGSTGGGGGSASGGCSNGNICIDATGAGDLTCVTPSYTIPSGAPSCGGSTGCAAGYSCWQLSSTSYVCLEDCSTPSTGGGPGGGSGTTGGGGGSTSTGGPCLVASTTCTNASGQGDYACLATNTTSGIPSNAPRCGSTTPCPSNYSCWSSASGAYCLQDCTPGATGGGSGTTGGGTGTTGGGTGTTGGGAGNTGGGSAMTGGGTGATGGGTGATGGGSAMVTPPLFFPAVPKSQPYAAGGCSALPESAPVLWLALSGLVVLRRRKR